jgi:hypothetical protein
MNFYGSCFLYFLPEVESTYGYKFMYKSYLYKLLGINNTKQYPKSCENQYLAYITYFHKSWSSDTLTNKGFLFLKEIRVTLRDFTIPKLTYFLYTLQIVLPSVFFQIHDK